MRRVQRRGRDGRRRRRFGAWGGWWLQWSADRVCAGVVEMVEDGVIWDGCQVVVLKLNLQRHKLQCSLDGFMNEQRADG